MKRIALVLVVGLFSAGCVGSREGLRIQVQTRGFTLGNSWANVYNNAGPAITTRPFSEGNDGFVAEYKLGKRNPWCLWLCRKKEVTKLVELKHGGHVSIPLRRNWSGQFIRESLSLLVFTKRRVIGIWSYCITMPPDRPVNEDIHFGPQELRELKEGNPGIPCHSYGW